MIAQRGIKLEKRYSGGLNFLINYTFSKFIDDVESAAELGGEQGNGYQHLELRHLDKALAGNDIRNRLISSMVYELPFGRGRHFTIDNGALNAIVGGWGIGLIAEFRNGSPFGVVENTNRSNTFSHAQRPHLLGQPERLSNWRDNIKGNTYFDTALYAAPGVGVFGSAPRNVCCGPGFTGIDLSVHKWFNFTERYKLQYRADFYNLPNTPAFANPELRRGRGGFGRVSLNLTGSNGRLIQMSLRFEF